MAPGPFVPTVITSAVIAAAAPAAVQQRLLPGLVDGSTIGAVALDGEVELRDGRAARVGRCRRVGCAGEPLAGRDRRRRRDRRLPRRRVTTETPRNLDPTRRSARVTLDGAAAEVVPGARQVLVDYARLLFSAEAAGVARECTEMAAEYAKVREQFGRPIAMYQAVKHHCANMLVATELCTAAVWDAARAAATGGEQLSLTAALAATLAIPAGDLCAQLNIQVHGGIGFTWEHDAHLYLRRATAIEAIVDAEAASAEVTELTRRGVRRERTVDLPPEAEPIRAEVRALAERIRGLDAAAQRTELIETGYAMPHWPEPWGRDAGAIEQLVIEQEFTAAGVKRPGLRHHRLGDPHADPARDRGPGRAVGATRAEPGPDLVPAVQRARRGVRRRGREDARGAGRRRLDA